MVVVFVPVSYSLEFGGKLCFLFVILGSFPSVVCVFDLASVVAV